MNLKYSDFVLSKCEQLHQMQVNIKKISHNNNVYNTYLFVAWYSYSTIVWKMLHGAFHSVAFENIPMQRNIAACYNPIHMPYTDNIDSADNQINLNLKAILTAKRGQKFQFWFGCGRRETYIPLFGAGIRIVSWVLSQVVDFKQKPCFVSWFNDNMTMSLVQCSTQLWLTNLNFDDFDAFGFCCDFEKIICDEKKFKIASLYLANYFERVF